MKKGSLYNFYTEMPGWAKGVSIVIVMAIIGIFAWRINKYLKNRPPSVHYPNGGEGIPAGFDPIPYAKKAHDEMSGISILFSPGRDTILTQIALLSTDDMFASVYDVFNQMYMKEGEGTFREWINDESFAPFSPIPTKLNARFDKLNLK